MSENNHKRILLVDDEEQVLFVVSESLEKLGAEAEIVTAGNGEEALEKIKESFFDLVITDLKMPKMDGVQLTEGIKAFSPETQVIWMTAFGNKVIQSKAKAMDVRHFLNKPLDIADIRKIAQEALETTMERKAQEKLPLRTDEDGLSKRMAQLQTDTSAYAVLLITTVGNLVDSAGLTQDLDVDTLSALIAGNFMASNQIANMLGRESNFKLSYHESDQHNIYSYGVGENYLLVTVFGGETRPGIVWFYAQRAASDLAEILSKMDIEDEVNNSLEGVFTEETEGELDNILENLWATDDDKAVKEEAPVKEAPKAAPKKEVIAQESASAAPVETMSYEEAVAQGLIPGK